MRSPRLVLPLAALALLVGCGSSDEPASLVPGSAPPPSGAAPPPTTPVVPGSPSAPGAPLPGGPADSGELVVPQPGRAVLTLTGTVEAGVESGCLVLSDRGASWVLVGAVEDLAPGATVTVTGTPDPGAVSSCQQGTVFTVTSTDAG